MFQTFNSTTRPEDGPGRLALLRAAMARVGVDAFLVPRADMHQGEYVAPGDERLSWLTGFTGSAGFAAITAGVAGVFVDGRYRLQLRAQSDMGAFTPVDWPETRLADWLRTALPGGGVLGFDPWLHTVAQVAELTEVLAGSGIALEPCANLVDRVWDDRPAPPMRPLVAYTEHLAGEGAEAKRARLAEGLRKAGHEAAILMQPDAVAWLLNIRGADLPRVPVALAVAILHEDGRVALFLHDPAQADAALRSALGPEVSIAPMTGLEAALDTLAGPVLADRDSLPRAVADRLEAAGCTMAWGRDPCLLPKACKNATELAGATEAHLRDAAAMAEFLCWLDGQDPASLTEIDVVRALEGFRADTGCLRDLAFDTICGVGPNGAIVHYRVTEASNRRLSAGEILLVDSGAQYEDGTTDVTRTISLGPAPDGAAKAAFTRVLQGMIAISRIRFPRGVAGAHLDVLARAALWRAGQDYDHGTGHGVGHYLSVHEGPQRLSRLSREPLRPGMILSNEPGYYRTGAFGIRIENLVVVEEAPPLAGADARDWISFRTLTHVPIDRRLIEPGLLETGERAWLDTYHADVLARVAPRCSDRARLWLSRACAPL